MKIRWKTGNLKGLEDDVAQAAAESAVMMGTAEYVDRPDETASIAPPENAAKRTGRAKARQRSAPKKQPKA